MAITSLFGPTPQELIAAQVKEQEQMDLLRNQQIAQQGSQFGVFAPLYQAGLKFGDLGSRAITQSLFPEVRNPQLQQAQTIQDVLQKYQGQNLGDTAVLQKVASDLFAAGAPDAGIKTLATIKALAPEKDAGPFGKVNPSDYTTASISAFQKTGGKDYSVLVPRPKEGEGTQFERILETLPEEQRQPFRLSWLKKQTEGSGMPASLVPIALKEADAASSIAFGAQEVKSVLTDLQSGKLQLGLRENFQNQFKTFAGASDEGARAYSKFNTALETLRNARLNLNVGVQTEGDAVRAMNEFLANFDRYDTKTAIEQLNRVQQKLTAAQKSKESRLSGLYSQYGVSLPKGFFTSYDGADTGTEKKQAVPDSVIDAEFNRPENAGWKTLGRDAFKKKFLELYNR
jgi:hypothetical protein